jgi:CheY-like chemotaxis protein
LDLTMPDLNGFDVLDILKSDPETREIPVVIHTSQELGSDDRVLLHDAVDIVPKHGGSRGLTGARIAGALTRAGLPLSRAAA